MTLENALLVAVSSVTGALCFLARILWHRSEQCEADRKELRSAIESVRTQAGENHGMLMAYRMCPGKPCPFKETIKP